MSKRFFPLICLIACLFQAFVFSDLQAKEPDMKTFLSEYYFSPERNYKLYSKLLYAVEKEYQTIAFKLLKNGEDPNYLSKIPKIPTPFILAVLAENEEMVMAMIRYGADVNLEAYLDETSLYSPITLSVTKNKNETILKMLISRGVNIDQYRHAIRLAMGKIDYPKFLVLAEGIDQDLINTVSLSSYNSYLRTYEDKSDSVKIAKHLFDRGSPVETKLCSALTWAIKRGNRDLFDFYLSIGANVHFLPEKIERKKRGGIDSLDRNDAKLSYTD